MRWFAIVLMALCAGASDARVEVRRCPGNGREPQLLVDTQGTVHLIYLAGEAKAGDLIYRASPTADFEHSLTGGRVNEKPGSVTIVGSVRGPQMAVDRFGNPLFIWTGNDAAQPTPRLAGLPLLFRRQGPVSGSFFPEKRVIESVVGIDGGAAIAARGQGEIDIVWHAPAKKGGDEQSRRIWVARSKDDGATFAAPAMVDTPALGACGCCALHAFADGGGALDVLYRTADQIVHRDMMLVSLDADLKPTACRKLSEWPVGKCVMSTSSESKGVIAWESQDQILVARADSRSPTTLGRKNPKHPRVAVAGDRVLVAWTEETGWNKGGKLAWQMLDRELKPIEGQSGGASDLPVWDYPAVAALADGSFLILY